MARVIYYEPKSFDRLTNWIDGGKAHSYNSELWGFSTERQIGRFNSKEAIEKQDQLMEYLTSAVKILGEESNNGKLLKKYVNNLKKAEDFNKMVMYDINTAIRYKSNHKNIPLLLKANMLYDCLCRQKYHRKLYRTNQKIMNINRSLGKIAKVGKEYSDRHKGFRAMTSSEARQKQIEERSKQSEERKKLNEIINKQPYQLKTNRRRH